MRIWLTPSRIHQRSSPQRRSPEVKTPFSLRRRTMLPWQRNLILKASVMVRRHLWRTPGLWPWWRWRMTSSNMRTTFSEGMNTRCSLPTPWANPLCQLSWASQWQKGMWTVWRTRWENTFWNLWGLSWRISPSGRVLRWLRVSILMRTRIWAGFPWRLSWEPLLWRWSRNTTPRRSHLHTADIWASTRRFWGRLL